MLSYQFSIRIQIVANLFRPQQYWECLMQEPSAHDERENVFSRSRQRHYISAFSRVFHVSTGQDPPQSADPNTSPTIHRRDRVIQVGPQEKVSKNGRWSAEQHRLFVKFYDEYGKKWKEISDHIPSRTSEQVRSHAQKFLARAQKEDERKKAQEEALRYLKNPQIQPKRTRRKPSQYEPPSLKKGKPEHPAGLPKVKRIKKPKSKGPKKPKYVKPDASEVNKKWEAIQKQPRTTRSKRKTEEKVKEQEPEDN